MRRGITNSFLLRASLAASAALLLLPALAQQTPPPDTGDDATAPAAVPASSPFLPVALALREGRFEEAARMLRGMDRSKFTQADRARWRRQAAQAALRTGDRAWLLEIVRDPGFISSADEVVTVSAMRLLQEGRFSGVRGLLGAFKEPQKLGEIPRRRYLALHARLAQFDGTPQQERVYVAKLVSFLGKWGDPTCQGCHANPRKFGEAVTTFDAANWWAGRRFSALLPTSDAERIRAESEKRLAAAPNDGAARLRLAFALRALNRPAEAESALRALPWVEFPDREKRAPLRLAVFP